MKSLVIIRGYSASGKTSVATEIAKRKRFQLIGYDTFFFGLNRHRDFLPSDFKITFSSVLDCLENCMKHKRNVILEGALSPIHKWDVFDIKKILALARKYDYKIVRILLVADYKICKKRMAIRKSPVHKGTFDQIAVKIRDTPEKGEIIIDTSNLSMAQLLEKVNAHIGQRKDVD